jgi:hypothetical protein
MGGKRPRQSHGVSVLPDDAGVASVAARHPRGTDVLRLSPTHRLEPGGSGPDATRTRLPHHGGGELPGMSVGGWGGRGDVLRGSHGDVAGAESGASSAERSTSEHGNHLWSARWRRGQRRASGWAHRRPTGQGWGGAAVVVAGVTTCLETGRAGHRAKGGSGSEESRKREESWRLQYRKMRHRMVTSPAWTPTRPMRLAWVRGGGYRRCRPSFTVGREPAHGRNHGEPVAWRHARRVRRAAWGNGPAAMLAPRPKPTHPHAHHIHSPVDRPVWHPEAALAAMSVHLTAEAMPFEASHDVRSQSCRFQPK